MLDAERIFTMARAAAGTLYVVVWEATRKAYVESPEEQGLRKKDAQEGLVRAFFTEEEATVYLLGLKAYNEAELCLVEVTSTQLAGLMRFSLHGAKLPTHADISRAIGDEWPVSLETIWTTNPVLH